jgi:hypothetical protein
MPDEDYWSIDRVEDVLGRGDVAFEVFTKVGVSSRRAVRDKALRWPCHTADRGC